MTRGEAWTHHAANLLVGGSGLAFAWMLYVAETDDPFALANHPWQPQAQALHLWSAPLLAFAVGLAWTRHVWGRIRAGFRPRRRTGIALAVAFWPMVASGYLLQTAVDEGWREVWRVLHLATGLGWAPLYLLHQCLPRSGADTRRAAGV